MDEYGVDLDEVFKVVDNAEVLVVRFHIVQKRLLVDFRTRPGVPPFAAVVQRAESVEDRFRSIKRLRPEFGYPEKVLSFSWPRSIPVLVASGAWQHIAERLQRLAGGEGLEVAERAMRELMGEERTEVCSAITGAEHYQTLWERRRA